MNNNIESIYEVQNLSKVVHLSDDDLVKSGSIYSARHLVELVYDMVKPFINYDTVIGEFAAGYGIFLDVFNDCGCKRIIASDIDEKSVQFIQHKFPNVDVYCGNTLENISREKYGLDVDDELIVIGNPPYNDTTSQYRNGEKGENICDSDVKSRDLGISFLRTYDKLKAEYICILHPLSYLIKKANFNSLKGFINNYSLISATIFSSKEFESIQKGNNGFPVVAALYKRGGSMSFSDMLNFKFNILGESGTFIVGNIKTIDGKINKYPSKNSNSTLQFYTLRDMNSLLRNKAFVENNPNGVDVTPETLPYYSWLFYLKNNFKPAKNKYLYGNLSPLWTDALENDDFKQKCVSYAVLKSTIVQKFFVENHLKTMYGDIISNPEPSLQKELEKLYII